MKATEQLKAEHKGIQLMLDILEEICKRLESDEKIDANHLEQIVEFFRVFADKCHHGKEEDLLFPELEKSGIPKKGGPIAVMLLEHKKGREYIKGMVEGVIKYKSKDAKTSSKIIESARGYIGLLRQHIDKENNILFAMADKNLSCESQDELLEKFERIEIERIGIGTHEKFHELLKKLKELYLEKGGTCHDK